MRHLINTYIQADPATLLGDLSALSLTDLIIKTGIHDAIAKKLNEKGRLSNGAIAEAIINNVRKAIVNERLADPRFYEEMSKLLDDLIQQKRDDTESYEQFLKDAQALVERLAKGQQGEDLPEALRGNKRAAVLYNNLPGILAAIPAAAGQVAHPTPSYGDESLMIALKLDKAIRENAPADWKGDSAREAMVLNAIYPVMKRDRAATEAIFAIIKQQPDY
jgi:type I restriction enzyme R subunit